MLKKFHLSNVYFGWWSVLAGGLMSLWAYGFQWYGFSALFKPISEELGFTRATTSIAASVGRLEGGFDGPISGWITDKFGPRWIMLSGIVLLSTGFVLMYFVHSLWPFLLVWGIMVGMGANIGLGTPLDTAIANWFVKKRGIASSTKNVMSGLSGAVILPVVAILLNATGWRNTLLIGGIVMFVIGVPLTLTCFKQRRPEYYGILPDGAKADGGTREDVIEKGIKYAAEVSEVEFSLKQAMRTPTYWLLVLVSATNGLVAPVMSIHAIPFLTDNGIPALQAAGMLALMVFASIPARIVAGIVADRIHTGALRYIMMATYLTQALGVVIFLLNRSTAAIYFWFILYGIGMGSSMTINHLIRARYFGRKAFGTINGMLIMLMTPVGVAAPIYVGWMFDRTGSYLSSFTMLALLLVISAFIFPMIRPPRVSTSQHQTAKAAL